MSFNGNTPILKILNSRIVFNRPTKDKLSIPDAKLIIEDIIALTEQVQAAGLSNNLASGNIIVGNALGKAVSIAMSGEATIDNTGVVTLDNAAVIAKVLTGFTSSPGVITAADSLLEAIQKLDGNSSALQTDYTNPFLLMGG